MNGLAVETALRQPPSTGGQTHTYTLSFSGWVLCWGIVLDLLTKVQYLDFAFSDTLRRQRPPSPPQTCQPSPCCQPHPCPFAPSSYGNPCHSRHVENIFSVDLMVPVISRSSTPVNCSCSINLACAGAIPNCLCISDALLLPCSHIAIASPSMTTAIPAIKDHHCRCLKVDDNNC